MRRLVPDLQRRVPAEEGLGQAAGSALLLSVFPILRLVLVLVAAARVHLHGVDSFLLRFQEFLVAEVTLVRLDCFQGYRRGI